MCSRLWMGSASIPSRVSRLVAAVLTRSPRSSGSARTAAVGAENDLSTEMGTPDVLPGV